MPLDQLLALAKIIVLAKVILLSKEFESGSSRFFCYQLITPLLSDQTGKVPTLTAYLRLRDNLAVILPWTSAYLKFRLTFHDKVKRFQGLCGNFFRCKNCASLLILMRDFHHIQINHIKSFDSVFES